MFRSLLRWVVPLVFVSCFCLTNLRAQPPTDLQRGAHNLPPAEGQAESSDRNPAPAYVVAALFVIGTLTVLCMPSRKG